MQNLQKDLRQPLATVMVRAQIGVGNPDGACLAAHPKQATAFLCGRSPAQTSDGLLDAGPRPFSAFPQDLHAFGSVQNQMVGNIQTMFFMLKQKNK